MADVSRDKLYEQVWSRPMTKVAADYGVTSTALKKTCVRHQIPMPERGYWAKRDYGKRVRQEPLSKLSDPRLAEVRIVGSPAGRLPEGVRQAKRQARERLVLEPVASEQSVAAEPYVEAPILAATRRAISKARPDKEGFITASGAGIVPLRVGPSSLDRALHILSHFLAPPKLQGYYNPKATDTALVLVVDGESIAFGIEEQPQKTLHQPTPDELRRQGDYSRWGCSGTPWCKYDRSPSQRLTIVINENSYSGLRRTYADGKTQTLDELLPTILAGFAEHAALLKERRRAAEEQQRQWKEAEARRMREEAFNARTAAHGIRGEH